MRGSPSSTAGTKKAMATTSMSAAGVHAALEQFRDAGRDSLVSTPCVITLSISSRRSARLLLGAVGSA
jgi:hypothetical protein